MPRDRRDGEVGSFGAHHSILTCVNSGGAPNQCPTCEVCEKHNSFVLKQPNHFRLDQGRRKPPLVSFERSRGCRRFAG